MRTHTCIYISILTSQSCDSHFSGKGKDYSLYLSHMHPVCGDMDGVCQRAREQICAYFMHAYSNILL